MSRLFARWNSLVDHLSTLPLPADVPGSSRTLYNSTVFRWLRAPSILSCFVALPFSAGAFYYYYAPPLFSPEVTRESEPDIRAKKFIEAKQRILRERMAKRSAVSSAPQSPSAAALDVPLPSDVDSDSDSEPLSWVSSSQLKAPEYVAPPPRRVSPLAKTFPIVQDPLFQAGLMFALTAPLLGGLLWFNSRCVRTLQLLPNRQAKLTFINNFINSKSIQVPVDLILPPYAVQGTRELFVHRLHVVDPKGNGMKTYFVMAPANDKRLPQGNLKMFETFMADNRFRDSELKV